MAELHRQKLLIFFCKELLGNMKTVEIVRTQEWMLGSFRGSNLNPPPLERRHLGWEHETKPRHLQKDVLGSNARKTSTLEIQWKVASRCPPGSDFQVLGPYLHLHLQKFGAVFWRVERLKTSQNGSTIWLRYPYIHLKSGIFLHVCTDSSAI